MSKPVLTVSEIEVKEQNKRQQQSIIVQFESLWTSTT